MSNFEPPPAHAGAYAEARNEAFAFLAMLSFFLLSTSGVVDGYAVQRRVGIVHTPVAFGHVHVRLKVAHPNASQWQAYADEVMERLWRYTSSEASLEEHFYTMMQKATLKIKHCVRSAETRRRRAIQALRGMVTVKDVYDPGWRNLDVELPFDRRKGTAKESTREKRSSDFFFFNETESTSMEDACPIDDESNEAESCPRKTRWDPLRFRRKRPPELRRKKRAPPELRRDKRSFLGLAAAAGISIVSVGLGLSNKLEVAKLRGDLDQMAHDQSILMASAKHAEEHIDVELAKVKGQLNEVMWTNRIVDRFHSSQMQICESLDESSKLVERSLYAALRGQLDPAMVDLQTLFAALEKVSSRASKLGMKIALDTVPIQAMFSTPISITYDNIDGNLDVFISIPLVPALAPTLTIWEIEQVPVRSGEKLLQADTSEIFLLMDEQRELHAEIRRDRLSSCVSFLDQHFCRHISTLYERSNSCAYAVYKNQRENVRSFCSIRAYNAPIAIRPFDPQLKTYDFEVTVANPTVLTPVCPFGTVTQPDVRVHKEARIKINAGCYMRTEDLRLFVARAPGEIRLVQNSSSWGPPDLLGEIQEPEAIVAMRDIPTAQGMRGVDLSSIRDRVAMTRTKNAFVISHLLLWMAVLFFIGERILIYSPWLRNRRRRLYKHAAMEETTTEGLTATYQAGSSPDGDVKLTSTVELYDDGTTGIRLPKHHRASTKPRHDDPRP